MAAAANPAPSGDASPPSLSPWFGAAALLLLATLLAAAFVQARQYALLESSARYQDDYLVLSLYQTEIEYLRLREQWQAEAWQAGSAPKLALRYEIFLSRASLLANERAHALLGDGDLLDPTLRQIGRFRQQADPYLTGATPQPMAPADARRLLAELQALGEPIHGMVIAATHQLAGMVTTRQAQLQSHNRVGLALTGGLLALLLVLALVALRQMRLLALRRQAQQALVDQLRLARREAEAANAAKTEFLADMSHELRTPLNGLMGMLSLARDAPADPRAAGWLAVADDSAAHLLRLIDDILDLSKLESDALVLDPQPLALRPLLAEVQALLQPTAQAKGLALVVQADPQLPAQVLLDATRLRQVLFNLLANAIKFSDRGTVLLDCRCAHAAQGGPQLQVEVSDTGIGMDPAMVSRLFQRFSQAHDPRAARQGGTGLGLAISRKLVRLMGGELGVRSEAGQGSTFYFSCPVQLPAPAASTEAAAPASRDPGRPLRVLVAEDHPVNQLYLSTMLERLGHQVVVVDDGQAALQQLQASGGQAFDLVLMDVHMPVMDGVAATERIRRLPGAAGRTCVVALTADVFADTHQRCLHAGVDQVMSKPLAMPALQDLLQQRFGASPATPAPQDGPADAPAANLATPPLLNHDTVRRVRTLMGADKAPALYSSFFDQAQRALQQMRAAMRDADTATLRDCAHTLKGAALNLGLPALADAAERAHHDAGQDAAAPLALALQRLEATTAATRLLWDAEQVDS